jgi:hemerythrin-like domain-containing protein
MSNHGNRRSFIGIVAATGAALVVRNAAATKPPKKDDDVPPTEDLMREHGVLRRILFVYDEVIRRANAKEPIPADALADAARIIREFIEDYHEKDEEEFVFPRLEKAGGAMGELVGVLRRQHQVGRKITDDVLRMVTPASGNALASPHEVAARLAQFNRMYRAHAAREDTVLFPAFRDALSEKELSRLQDVFEDKEKALPHGGFEKMVEAVGKIEERFGVHDLAKLTP